MTAAGKPSAEEIGSPCLFRRFAPGCRLRPDNHIAVAERVDMPGGHRGGSRLTLVLPPAEGIGGCEGCKGSG
jgi:hypothetical protein